MLLVVIMYYLIIINPIIKDNHIIEKSSLRKRADKIKEFRGKNLIAVLEEPIDQTYIGTVIRNINALGVENSIIVDCNNLMPENWQDMREKRVLLKSSVSAVKWSFVKKFKSTEEYFQHLEKNNFISFVTSPHIMGKKNIILHEGIYTQKN